MNYFRFDSTEKERLLVMPELRRAITECVGTYLIVLSSALGSVIPEVTKDESLSGVGHLASAFVVTALVYGTGQISGAHFNPIISLAFLLRGVFDWRRFLFYVPAQFLGGIIAGGTVYGIFGTIGDCGSTVPMYLSEGKAFVIEMIITMLLVFVALNVGARAQLIGANAGIPMGAARASGILAAGAFTGASMDPARSFGPAVFAGGNALKVYWIYLIGPTLGAVIAVMLMYFLSDRINPKEEEAATGKGTAIQEHE